MIAGSAGSVIRLPVIYPCFISVEKLAAAEKFLPVIMPNDYGEEAGLKFMDTRQLTNYLVRLEGKDYLLCAYEGLCIVWAGRLGRNR